MKLKTKEEIDEGVRKFLKHKVDDWTIQNPPRWKTKKE